MDVDFMVKLRDAAQLIADAANEQLKKIAPVEVKNAWDPNKVGWVKAEGSKGPYERYPAQGQRAESTPDYRNMLEDLKAHGDKMTRGDFFFWVFSDGATVGRKRKRK